MTYLLLSHLHLLRLLPLRARVMRPMWSRLRRHPRAVFASILFGLIAHPAVAHACAVCVGDPNDPQTKGATSAVWLLMGITGCVLSCFVAFFGFLWWRSRHPVYSATTYLGTHQDKLRKEDVRS